MLHKPAGVLSATEDGRGETVLDLLAPEYRKIGLFPVGRLDKDTEGLLLLTDDGALAHDLLAPKKHVDKVYFARTDGALDDADCKAFEQGITLGDGLECLPAKLEILKSDAQSEAHHHPRGQVPPDQADAGIARKAGRLLKAAEHGLTHA